MRSYELVFIVNPAVDADGLAALIDSVQNTVVRSGGKVVQVEPWGLRRLAYPIRRQWEGQYVLMRLELDPKGVADVERSFKLSEQIMRHLIVCSDE